MSHHPAVFRHDHGSRCRSQIGAFAAYRLLPLAVAAWVATGCAHRPAQPDPRPVQHVVICWLKNPGDADARAALLATCGPLRAIPGLQAVHAGTTVPSERAVVDDSFDVALVMTFSDVAAMQSYVTHPAHQNILRDVVAPLVSRVVIYDIVAGQDHTIP